MRKLDENNQKERYAREWPVYLLALVVCFILWWGGIMFAHEYALTEFRSEQKSVTSEKKLSDEERCQGDRSVVSNSKKKSPK